VCLKVPEFDKDLKYSSDETISCSCLNTLTTWDSETGQVLRLLDFSGFGFVARTNGVGDLRGFNNKEQPFLKFIARFQQRLKGLCLKLCNVRFREEKRVFFFVFDQRGKEG